MKRVSLDLVTPPRHPWGYACLAIGALMFTLGLALYVYLDQIESPLIADADALHQRVRGRRADAPIAIADDDVPRRRVVAAVAELGVPWESMFHALEQTRTDAQGKRRVDPVLLEAIEPDARDGTVRLTAQAPRFNDATHYVERLMQHPPLADVIMVSHQVGATPSPGTVRFVVVARWRPR
jgi:hypothetical protein